VIDGFDAMTSLRPYRDSVGLDAAWQAMAELEAQAGSWYEPEAVRVFRDLLEAGRLDSTLEHLNDHREHETLVGPLTPDVLELARDALVRSAPEGEDPERVDRLLSLASHEATGDAGVSDRSLDR
jgi:3-hydroxyacyl-CoA dehydrogenase